MKDYLNNLKTSLMILKKIFIQKKIFFVLCTVLKYANAISPLCPPLFVCRLMYPSVQLKCIVFSARQCSAPLFKRLYAEKGQSSMVFVACMRVCEFCYHGDYPRNRRNGGREARKRKPTGDCV